MRPGLLPGAVLAVLVALLGLAPGTAAPLRAQDAGGPMISLPMASVPLDGQGRPLYRPGEVLVRYKAGLGALSLGAGARHLMGDARPLAAAGPLARSRRVKLPPGTSVTAALAELRSDPAVESADPNYLNYKMLTPRDEFWGVMWSLENTGQTLPPGVPYSIHNPGTPDADVDASAAWDLATGAGVVIAIIDSGVDYTHPDLNNNMWDASAAKGPDGVTPLNSANHGYDFGDNDDDPMRQTCSTNDSGWHGTHVAGTAAAEATLPPPSTIVLGSGIPGMAFDAQIMAVKVFPDANNCSAGATDANIALAIDYARVNGANVINLSLGRTGPESATITAAVRAAIQAGVVIVAAAGNATSDNDITATWPANYAADSDPVISGGFISVAASDQSDYPANFTNYGLTKVSIAAPGVNIGSTYTDSYCRQGYAYSDGTSMASPLVAGIAALVRETMIAGGTPSPTPAAIKARILDTGDAPPNLAGCTSSSKRANAANAVANTSVPAGPNSGPCSGPSGPLATGGSALPFTGSLAQAFGEPLASTTQGSCVPSRIVATASTSGHPGPCLITWATEDWLPDRALDPLRRVRASLWQQGGWGRALVRAYYRTSAAVLGRLYAPPAPPHELPDAGPEPALSAAPMP